MLTKTHNFPDIELHTLLFNCFCNFVLCCYSSCIVENGQLLPCKNPDMENKILEVIKESKNYHWRPKLYCIIYILLNVSSLTSPSGLLALKQYVADILLDENIDIRETGISLAISLLYKHVYSELPVKTFELELADFTTEGRYLDLDHLDNNLAYKVYHGWSDKKDTIKIRKSGLPNQDDPLFEFFTDYSKVKKFLEFLAVSHMVDSEENIIKNPRPKNFDNLNYAIRYLNNPHKFFSSLLNNRSRFTNSSVFSLTKPKFIKLIGKAYGPESMKVLVDVCKEYLNKEKPYQLSAIEIVAGIGSASKYWEDDSLFIRLFEFAIKECAIHGSNAWTNAIDFISKNQVPERLIKIFNILVGAIPTVTSKKLKKLLRFIGKVAQKLA